MDLAKWYPDRFGRFLATIAARDVLWVQAQSQIARTRADFRGFCEMSEN